MHFTTTAIISILSATTLALPQPVARDTEAWLVSSYTEGCSPGGCVYSFDLSVPSDPSFGGAADTHCEGTRSTTSPSTNCTNTQFQTSSKVIDPTGAILFVTRYFPFGDETDVAGGNVTTAGPGEVSGTNFVINAQVYGELAN